MLENQTNFKLFKYCDLNEIAIKQPPSDNLKIK